MTFCETNKLDLRVPYTFFVTRQWAFLLCVKREWRFLFSVISESIFFRPRELGFRFFRDPWNMHLLSHNVWTNDFCGNIFFDFFELLASLKLVNYTKLDVKRAHSMRPCGCKADRELTTATVNLEGLESAIIDKSLGENLHFEHKSDANTTSPV